MLGREHDRSLLKSKTKVKHSLQSRGPCSKKGPISSFMRSKSHHISLQKMVVDASKWSLEQHHLQSTMAVWERILHCSKAARFSRTRGDG